jgi:transposase
MTQSVLMVIKKIKGNKRHIAVDHFGLLLDVIVDRANQHDSQKLLPLLEKIKEHKPYVLETILADKAYRGYEEKIRIEHQLTLDIKENLSKSGFEILDSRWIVERSFAWMKGARRLSKDYEKSPKSSENMVKLTFIKITLNKLAAHKKIFSG